MMSIVKSNSSVHIRQIVLSDKCHYSGSSVNLKTKPKKILQITFSYRLLLKPLFEGNNNERDLCHDDDISYYLIQVKDI